MGTWDQISGLFSPASKGGVLQNNGFFDLSIQKVMSLVTKNTNFDVYSLISFIENEVTKNHPFTHFDESDHHIIIHIKKYIKEIYEVRHIKGWLRRDVPLNSCGKALVKIAEDGLSSASSLGYEVMVAKMLKIIPKKRLKKLLCHALQTAVANGQINVVITLLKNNANLKALTYHELTSIVKNDDAIMVGFLIEHGINPLLSEPRLLINMAEKGNYRMLIMLLEKSEVEQRILDEALGEVVSSWKLNTEESKLKFTESFKILIKHGANVHAGKTFYMGQTLLARVGSTATVEIIQFLCANGVDIAEFTDNILEAALLENSLENAVFLLNHGRTFTNINRCTPSTLARNNHTEALKLLLTHHSTNISQKEKNSLLDQACSNNNIEMVRLLLDHRADINYALIVATSRKNLGLVQFLLEKGANPFAANYFQSSSDITNLFSTFINHQIKHISKPSFLFEAIQLIGEGKVQRKAGEKNKALTFFEQAKLCLELNQETTDDDQDIEKINRLSYEIKKQKLKIKQSFSSEVLNFDSNRCST